MSEPLPSVISSATRSQRDRVRQSVFSRALVWPALGARGLIWTYQKTLSPVLAALNPACGCRFAPTCSHYAIDALNEHGLIFGFFLTIRRLVKCGPWHPGGEDPVPSRRRPVCNKVSVS